MGALGYEKWYLFTKAEHCCNKYFPASGNCPYEDETQFPNGTGYYWESYQKNFPNSAGMFCSVKYFIISFHFKSRCPKEP